MDCLFLYVCRNPKVQHALSVVLSGCQLDELFKHFTFYHIFFLSYINLTSFTMRTGKILENLQSNKNLKLISGEYHLVKS